MGVLVFTENWEGKFKKSTFEAISYGNELAKKLSVKTTALVIGEVADADLKSLGKFGASKVLHVKNSKLNSFSAQVYSSVVSEAAVNESAAVVVFSNTYSGKNLAGRVSAKLKAGLVAGAIGLPVSTSPFTVQKKCFSGKGLTDTTINTGVKVISLTPNSFQIINSGIDPEVVAFSPQIKESLPSTSVKEVKKTSGKIPLTEADCVVSAGRGLKGPENWGMIEELANLLGAATACSKPVADIGWRPHHEHVGQTGITIGPDLYIAVGISGAIQHLAGVSSSKVIVVINSDPEAPFFKAADYGIVGDAFEVIPRLIQSVKTFKSSHS